VIAAIGERLDANGHRVVDGAGLVLAPAFVDPHVHLRTPGQEYKETLETGTRAAAAGGFCAVIAMPNTAPVIDEAAVLRSLIDMARREAHVPVGFLAAITRGLAGQELTLDTFVEAHHLLVTFSGRAPGFVDKRGGEAVPRQRV